MTGPNDFIAPSEASGRAALEYASLGSVYERLKPSVGMQFLVNMK